MVLPFPHLKLALISTFFPVFLSAQETSIDTIFFDAAQAHPQFALGVSYVVGQNDPIVITAGPTVRGGTVCVTDDVPWHIGSISKSFTSALVMRLVERGVVELDAPLGEYLKQYNGSMHPDWMSLSLRQLLSHTSGLPANVPRSIMKEVSGSTPHMARHAVLSAMWDKPLSKESGTLHYSNIGYVLAGFIAEEVTGRPWEELIRSEVSERLELKSLGFGPPTKPNAAWGHRSVLGLRTPVSPDSPIADNPAWMGPAGTIHLSMSDLVKWGQAHIAACSGDLPEFLTQKSCLTMQSPLSSNYGLGWVVQSANGAGKAVWHNGSNTMWYALISIFPESGLVVAAATNTYAPDRIEELVQRITEALVE